MKKICLTTLAFAICLSCGIIFTPTNISASSSNEKSYIAEKEYNTTQNYEGDEELAEFMSMQNDITKTLSLKDGKYIYDEEEIKEIVYKFDFTAYNKKNNTSFTKENFFDSAMKNIRDFKGTEKSNESSQIMARGTMCNQNWKENGWNYLRLALDKTRATKTALELKDAAEYFPVGGAAAALLLLSVPELAAVYGTIAGLSSAYLSSYSRWIDYNNKLTSCGIVTDQNKFTFVFDIWTQPEFAKR